MTLARVQATVNYHKGDLHMVLGQQLEIEEEVANQLCREGKVHILYGGIPAPKPAKRAVQQPPADRQQKETATRSAGSNKPPAAPKAGAVPAAE